MNIVTNPVPRTWHNVADHLSRISDVVNNILRGKLNNVGSITLIANSATTTLTDVRIGAYSIILLQPTTANSAAALANIYFGIPGNGNITINHANNSQTDRAFRFAVLN